MIVSVLAIVLVLGGCVTTGTTSVAPPAEPIVPIIITSQMEGELFVDDFSQGPIHSGRPVRLSIAPGRSVLLSVTAESGSVEQHEIELVSGELVEVPFFQNRDVTRWVPLLNEDFSGADADTRWVDISSRYGDGQVRIKTVGGERVLQAVRGDTHYGWAEAALPLGSRPFDLLFITEGVSGNDPYDRGVLYLVDDSGEPVFSISPDNYKKVLTVTAYEIDADAQVEENAVCVVGYEETDGRHDFQLSVNNGTLSLGIDGRSVYQGSYSGNALERSISAIRVMGRGSNRGSGLNYVSIVVRTPI